jgi:hypothetical protein
LPLDGAGRNRALPATPGLYRVRVSGADRPIYIGQTGRSIRERLGMLKGAYAELMPYNDPHTAAPALWSLHHRDGVDFECSAAPLDGDRRARMGAEALAISMHRVEHGGSPMANFGGMPDGYRKSSGNNSRLVAAGKRFRGGPDPTATSTPESVPVSGILDGSAGTDRWTGLAWSPWTPLAAFAGSGGRALQPGTGVYRIRLIGAGDHRVYVGQGDIASRLRTHAAAAADENLPKHEWLRSPSETSWVELDGVPTRALLELENDLIASHVLVCGEPPGAQFLG